MCGVQPFALVTSLFKQIMYYIIFSEHLVIIRFILLFIYTLQINFEHPCYKTVYVFGY